MADPYAIFQWFAAVDTDRSGSISVFELQRALAMGNLNYSLATCAHCIRLHDKDGSGSINFEEFTTLHNFLTNMQQSFAYFDTDRSGSLGANELLQAIRHAGFQLDQPSFYAMMKAFDPQRTGQLDCAEFIAMTLFLQSASNTFQAFDTTRRGKINLDFNQFVYAAANCR